MLQSRAYFIVWTMITFILMLILLLPFAASKQTVLAISPTCVSIIKNHRECPMCGMTRSFIAISNGHFSRANQFNRGSIILYGIFLLDIIIYGIYSIRFITNKKKTSNATFNLN